MQLQGQSGAPAPVARCRRDLSHHGISVTYATAGSVVQMQPICGATSPATKAGNL